MPEPQQWAVGVVAVAAGIVMGASGCRQPPADAAPPPAPLQFTPGYEAKERGGWARVRALGPPVRVTGKRPAGLSVTTAARLTTDGLEVAVGLTNSSERAIRVLPLRPDSGAYLVFRSGSDKIPAFQLPPVNLPYPKVEEFVELPGLHTLSTTYYVPGFPSKPRFRGVDAYRVDFSIRYLTADDAIEILDMDTEWAPVPTPSETGAPAAQ